MYVTIEEAAKLIRELSEGGDPSLLHALRAAALSPRMNLSSNSGYALVLKGWHDSPLPERYELRATLDQAMRTDGSGKLAYGRMESHLDTLYALDDFWFSGLWDDVIHGIGTTLDEQRMWRCRMNSLVRGMGFKCLSWALFIYDPLGCQVLTLDTWHAKRLVVDAALLMRDTANSHKLYEQLESQTIAEVSALYPGYPSTVGAACLWFNIRGQGYESHAGLNCRVQEYSQAAD